MVTYKSHVVSITHNVDKDSLFENPHLLLDVFSLAAFEILKNELKYIDEAIFDLVQY